MEKTEPAKSASWAGTFGVALGLALLLLCLAWLALELRGAAAFDAEQALLELMPGERPLGLALAESGALASGDRIVRLVPAEAERMDGEPVPAEVVLAFYASPAGPRTVFAEPEVGMGMGMGMGGMGGMDGMGGDAGGDAAKLEAWIKDPTQAAHVEIERGDVTFGGWRAPFVRRRALLAGGGTREVSCVDLSTPGRPLVLFAVWPDGREASRTVLRELLAGVTLPEPEEEPER